MSERMTFAKMTQDSRRFSRDEYVTNWGGIISDVVAMFNSDAAKDAFEQAKIFVDSIKPDGLPEHIPVRGRLPFGEFDVAPELARGEVAAIDGTLPQKNALARFAVPPPKRSERSDPARLDVKRKQSHRRATPTCGERRTRRSANAAKYQSLPRLICTA